MDLDTGQIARPRPEDLYHHCISDLPVLGLWANQLPTVRTAITACTVKVRTVEFRHLGEGCPARPLLLRLRSGSGAQVTSFERFWTCWPFCGAAEQKLESASTYEIFH